MLAVSLSSAMIGQNAAGQALADSVDVPARAGHRFDQTLILPYGNTISRSLSTGGTAVYYEDDFNKYPSTDIRAFLVGIIPGFVTIEDNGGTGLMSDNRSSDNLRGLTVRFFVDGQPFELNEIQIAPEEIESITFVKDIVDKALFGSRSSGGAVYITTKRGLVSGKVITVSMESGVSVVDRMPKWANGAEYATLQNQAREAAGYPINYTQEDIQAFALNNPDDLLHPSVDWRNLMLKNTKNYRKTNISIQGGTNAVSYAVTLNYAGEGDIYKAGQESGYNRMNIRANADMKITKGLSFRVNIFSGISFRRSPIYGYGSSGSYNEFGSFLSAMNTTPAVEFPLHVGTNAENGNWIYGVSENYNVNPYAALVENGFFTQRGRSGVIDGTLTWDISRFVKGLKFESYVGLNLFNMDRIGKNPDYLALIYDPDTGTTLTTSHEGTKVSGKSSMGKWYHQSLYLNERLSYTLEKGYNRFSTAGVFYLETTENSGSDWRERQQAFIFNADYAYGGKYLAQLVVNTAGCSMFTPGNRYAVFPAVGLGWVASKEKFLSNAKWINWLKLRAQAGIFGYNSFGAQDLYEDSYSREKGINFGPASKDFEWIGGSTRYQSYTTTLTRLGNKDLTWEKRKEATVGIEAKFLGNRLSLDADYYNNLRDGILTNTSVVYPDVYGMDGVSIYDNYNKIRYYGTEIALNWNDRIGDFQYSVGGWVSWGRGKYLKYCEREINEYNQVEGSHVGDYHGYVYLGKFTSQEDIDSSPKQSFDSNVQVGDLKYADINGDGTVDSNDRTIIGNTVPKWNFSVNIYLKYKDFDLTILGTGRAGFQTPLTSSYFWNGWGLGNYSAFVRDNIGGDYPRLSYDKSSNNFIASGFWLRDGKFFKIQNVEIGYNLLPKKLSWLGGCRFFVRGTNLLTISGIDHIDPESTTAGISAEPLYRTFTGGIKLKF